MCTSKFMKKTKSNKNNIYGNFFSKRSYIRRILVSIES